MRSKQVSGGPGLAVESESADSAETTGSVQLGDLVLGYLREIGVEYVFGVPGGAIEPLYNALARSERQGGPRAVVARHECGAAFMADGYTRETGRLGVCCATTGPGATNLITGVASAYADNIPMLVITAQTALPHFGRGALQESSCTAVNTVSMFKHCTQYSTLVSHPEQLEAKLLTAISLAFQSPGGPVHISVPRDVFATPWHTSKPASPMTKLVTRPCLVDVNALESLCAYIRHSSKCVLVIGRGAHGAINEIMRFAEIFAAEFVVTPDGKPLVDCYHPLYRGVFGFAGHESARAALVASDVECIVAIGTNLDEFATASWDRDALLNERLVHVDSNSENFTRSTMAKMHVFGCIGTVFKTLVERAKMAREAGILPERAAPSPPLWEIEALPKHQSCDMDNCPAGSRAVRTRNLGAYCSDDKPVKPQRMLCELVRNMPAHTRFVADAGNSFAWTTHYLNTREPDRYRVSMGFGTMAWAIGAAVGTAMGCRGCPVVCITGDGSFLMSGHELTVAVAEGLTVIYVVLNDSALGMVKHGQRLAGAEPIAYELPKVDYAAIARAVGARGYKVETPADFAQIDFEDMARHPGPSLLDVRIDSEEVPPMGMRVKTLAGVSVAE